MSEENINLNIGDIAPDFSLPKSKGGQIKLSELKGKFIVLYFYPKDDTPGCTLEARDFNQLRSEFEKRDAIIIGISKDDLNSHDNFKDKHCLEFDLVSDNESDTAERYGVWGKQSVLGVFKYTGIARTSFLIDKQGKIAYIWRNVSVSGHAAEVLNKIKEMI